MKKNSYSVRGGFLRNAKRALLTLAISSAALPASADVFQQIIDNVVARELSTSNVTSLVASAKTYMSNMKDDGSWPDVNYASKAQTNWPAMTHLNRLKTLAVAYVSPGSALKGDEKLYAQIVSGLNYWYAKKPVSTNWWYWEIGWPQEMGVILCLMRSGEKQLPEATEKKHPCLAEEHQQRAQSKRVARFWRQQNGHCPAMDLSHGAPERQEQP